MSKVVDRKGVNQMSLEDFKEKLVNDSEVLEKLEILPKYLDDEKVVHQLYDLCRKTYITQYSSRFFKNDDGTIVSFTPHEDFERLGIHIEYFINQLGEKDLNKTFDEVLILLKEYYISTATSDEISKRTYEERSDDKKQHFGVYGTYYDLNQIDWNFFSKGIKENIILN